MADVTVPVAIPSLLHACTGGRAEVTVRAGTLAEAIENLLRAYPLLRTNLFEENGAQREHVLIFYNDESTKWLDSHDVPLKEGDCLTVLQSVAGG